MSAQLVLSLFPGIGLLDRAFEEEGFCVVRGPDLLWGGDVRLFYPPAGRFDGVIGGPPCQLFSTLNNVNRVQEGKKVARHGNMIPEYERVVSEARPRWYLMENVPRAPEPEVAGYFVNSLLVRDVWVGGKTTRLRRFSFGTASGAPLKVEQLALHTVQPERAVLGGGQDKTRGIGDPRDWKGRARAQGLPESWIDLHEREGALTARTLCKVIGNGVPYAMGRAVAAAVRRALSTPEAVA